MNERTLRRALADLPLGEVRFFEQTGSSNDIALAWAAEGAPDLSLVYAEQQNSGRGRARRRWLTVAGGGLAFSLILRPEAGQERSPASFSALAALGVCSALEALDVPAEIKWPNDVLVCGRKVCGVLAEAVWLGEQVDRIVLGVGVNVTPASIPPADGLTFPATCLEGEGRQEPGPGRAAPVHPGQDPGLGTASRRDLPSGRQSSRAWPSARRPWSSAGGISGGRGTVTGRGAGRQPGPAGSRRVLRRIHFGELHLRPVSYDILFLR